MRASVNSAESKKPRKTECLVKWSKNSAPEEPIGEFSVSDE